MATLAGALGVVLSTNPVHAALMLVMTLFGVAVLFVAQEAHFLAAVQVIVYAGAIVVLFLFVIMLLGVDRVGGRRAASRSRASARWPSSPACCVLARRPPAGPRRLGVGRPQSAAGPLGRRRRNVEMLARSLFTRYLLAFEITSVLLVIAVVGAVVLARRSGDRPTRGVPTPSEEVERVTVPGAWYLALAAALFTIGAVGLLVRRNVLVMFMCVELMLNAVNLTFVTFARMLDDIGGQVGRVLRARRGRGRGGRRPRHHRLHLPAPRRAPPPTTSPSSRDRAASPCSTPSGSSPPCPWPGS